MADSLPDQTPNNNTRRRRLPNRRHSETLSFERDNLQFCMTTGFFPDGAIGEIFLNAEPHNSALDIFVSDAAILVSLCLQHGAPLEKIRHALRRDLRGNAASPIGFALDKIADTEVSR